MREATTIIFWCCKKQPYCKGASNVTTISQPLQDARTQQSIIIYTAGHKDDSNKHCWLQGRWQHVNLFASYFKEQWWQMMVDCNEEMWDHAMQQLSKPLCCIAGQATIAEQQHGWPDDDALHHVARGYNNSNDSSLQQACDITQTTATLFIDMDQPHQSLQRNKTPAIRLIATPQWEHWQRDNHSLLSYCMELQQ